MSSIKYLDLESCCDVDGLDGLDLLDLLAELFGGDLAVFDEAGDLKGLSGAVGNEFRWKDLNI